MNDIPKNSHVMKLADREVFSIILYEGYTINDEKMFAYMAVRMDKHDAFRRAVAGDKPFDIRDYGKVIASGLGDPSPELMEEVERDYDVRHDDMIKVGMKE